MGNTVRTNLIRTNQSGQKEKPLLNPAVEFKRCDDCLWVGISKKCMCTVYMPKLLRYVLPGRFAAQQNILIVNHGMECKMQSMTS